MRFARNHQLKTTRCILRHVSEDDIPHVFSATRAEGFNDGMQWEPPVDQSDLITPLENNSKAWEDDSAYVFTIESQNGEFVGRIAIRSTESADIWDLGFWTHPTWQGRGYMTEAVERILIFGFRELGAREIEARHASWNISSRRVLEKCGFNWREHIPEGFQKKGRWISEERLARKEEAEPQR
jgi:[ribosomal protein S5]-alanine N-acetyltransferase